MPIKITQKLGNKKKQFNVLTKEELSELFGGNIARAGEALGRQAELDKNLGILNDEKLPELDTKLTELDEDLDILEGNLTQLDEDLGILEGNLGTLDGYIENPSTIPAGYNFFTGIVANNVFTETLVAKDAFVEELTARNLFANTIVANETFTDTLTANKVFTDELVANKVFTDELVANNVFTDELVANSAFIEDLFAQTISVGGTISGNYSSTTGWRIQGNGDAEFNNVTVRGSGSSVADWQVQESNRSLFKTIPNTDFSYVHITNEPWGGDVTAGAGVRFGNTDLNSDTQVKYAHVGQLHELDSNSFTGNADASDAEWGIEVMLGQGSSSYKHIFRAGNGGVLLTNPNDDFLINEDGVSIRSTTIEAGITQRTYSILHGQTEVGSIYGFSTFSRDAIQISANDGWDLQIGAAGGGSVIINSARFRVPRTIGPPSNLENGMIWYDNTQSRFLKYEDGSVSFL